MSEVEPCDWICGDSFNSVEHPNNSIHKPHKFAITREGALSYTVNMLEEDGACLAKCVMEKYKELLITNYAIQDTAKSEFINYKKILKSILRLKALCATVHQRNRMLCITIS